MRAMTVRQAFYQATVRGLIEKNEAGYAKVQTDLVFMRRDGWLPYKWLADNTRWQRNARAAAATLQRCFTNSASTIARLSSRHETGRARLIDQSPKTPPVRVSKLAAATTLTPAPRHPSPIEPKRTSRKLCPQLLNPFRPSVSPLGWGAVGDSKLDSTALGTIAALGRPSCSFKSCAFRPHTGHRNRLIRRPLRNRRCHTLISRLSASAPSPKLTTALEASGLTTPNARSRAELTAIKSS
jgi:hypothetical protein